MVFATDFMDAADAVTGPLPGGGRRTSQSGRGLFNGMACPAAGNFTLFR